MEKKEMEKKADEDTAGNYHSNNLGNKSTQKKREALSKAAITVGKQESTLQARTAHPMDSNAEIVAGTTTMLRVAEQDQPYSRRNLKRCTGYESRKQQRLQRQAASQKMNTSSRQQTAKHVLHHVKKIRSRPS